MALDIKKLREMQKGIKNKAGQGEGLFLYANKITEEGIDFRILPPTPEMNGIFFVEEVGWWINGTFVVVNDDNDIIEDEIMAARESKDRELIALLDKKKNNMPLIKKETRYYVAGLLLNTKYEDDELVSCDVDEYKVLIAKPSLLTEINATVTSRKYQNKTKDGIADREKGYNITLMKEGAGLNTKYRAEGWMEPMEIDEKWYKDPKKPDILKLHKKSIKSDEYQSSVIRNYLYGEEILDDAKDGQDEDEAPEVRKATKKTVIEEAEYTDEEETPVRKTMNKLKSAKAPVEEVDDDVEEVPVRKTAPKKPAPAQRNLMDDAISDMSDLDE